MLRPLWQSFASMPWSSAWIPIVYTGLWAWFCLYPRWISAEPLNVIIVPLWFALWPVVAAWLLWAFVVIIVES